MFLNAGYVFRLLAFLTFFVWGANSFADEEDENPNRDEEIPEVIVIGKEDDDDSDQYESCMQLFGSSSACSYLVNVLGIPQRTSFEQETPEVNYDNDYHSVLPELPPCPQWLIESSIWSGVLAAGVRGSYMIKVEDVSIARRAARKWPQALKLVRTGSGYGLIVDAAITAYCMLAG